MKKKELINRIVVAGINGKKRSPVSETSLSLTEREASILAREKASQNRNETADRRDNDANRREVKARIKAELSADAKVQLREANERLVVAAIQAQTMTEAAETATAKMAFMAKHDFLTGLPNRLLLTDRLAQAISLARRHGKRVALMFLDLDHFKHVNDSLGHGVGDELLQSVSKRLQECVRNSDTIGRLGGDEFVVLLSEIESPQDASISAEKLIESMVAPHIIGDHRVHITLSIGISLYPDDARDVETVLRNADTAMYHAKRNGRNIYQSFTPDMNDHAVNRRSIENSLHYALEQRGLVLHYQPKVNLVTGAITGVEALVRLIDTDNNFLYPEQFVSIAEDCGLIVPIGHWVLREACRQTVAWLKDGLDIGQVAVNISAVEFHNKTFITCLCTILDETGLDPSRLEIELTESVLMQDTETTMKNLRELKNMGIQIAVDDFGTGYSSLSYLRKFSIDTLKIDQSFVQDIDGDSNYAIVSAVIAMGTSLKQRVVAEGIETREQLAFLQSRHCTEGQGYYFSRPVAAEECATLLAAGWEERTDIQ
jgi:diguanylate cyclase (GGDEF)-like protein